MSESAKRASNPVALFVSALVRIALLLFVVSLVPLAISIVVVSLSEDGWYNFGHPHERRAQNCKYNLRDIGRAMETYRRVHGTFPPAYSVDANGRKMHSWRALLLPYLELTGEDEALKNYDFKQPWDSAHNQQFADRMPYCYWCAAERKNPLSTTNYVAVVGNETLWSGDVGRSEAEVTDGAGTTIAVVEIARVRIPWLEPRDIPFSELTLRINDPGGHDPSSKHVSRVHVLMADGNVVTLSEATSPAKFRAMLTIAGGEQIDVESP